MKILHVIEASFAGVGRHVLDLAQGQVKHGHQVHVAYSPVRMSESFRAERDALGEIEWHEHAMTRSLAFCDLKSVVAICRLISKLRPDVVHGHSTKGGIAARVAAFPAKIMRKPVQVVYTPNAIFSMNPTLKQRSRAIIGKIERLLARITDTLIAVSPEEKLHIMGLGVPEHKIKLIHNGIRDVDVFFKFEVRQELGLPTDAKVVGFVGQLDSQKAPLDLIDVFQTIAEQDASTHFVLVGTGPMEKAVRARAKTFPFKDRLHILGERPGVWAMTAFDVFLLPSRYEGFPYVLLEAAASGLPIVTTMGASARDVVHHGKSGFICETGNIEQLASSTQEILHDDQLHASMSNAALQNGRTFTVDRMVEAVNRTIGAAGFAGTKRTRIAGKSQKHKQ